MQMLQYPVPQAASPCQCSEGDCTGNTTAAEAAAAAAATEEGKGKGERNAVAYREAALAALTEYWPSPEPASEEQRAAVQQAVDGMPVEEARRAAVRVRVMELLSGVRHWPATLAALVLSYPFDEWGVVHMVDIALLQIGLPRSVPNHFDPRRFGFQKAVPMPLHFCTDAAVVKTVAARLLAQYACPRSFAADAYTWSPEQRRLYIDAGTGFFDCPSPCDLCGLWRAATVRIEHAAMHLTPPVAYRLAPGEGGVRWYQPLQFEERVPAQWRVYWRSDRATMTTSGGERTLSGEPRCLSLQVSPCHGELTLSGDTRRLALQGLPCNGDLVVRIHPMYADEKAGGGGGSDGPSDASQPDKAARENLSSQEVHFHDCIRPSVSSVVPPVLDCD